MTVSQSAAGVCTVYQASHDWHRAPAHKDFLRCSPYIRRILHEGASIFGMTQMRLTTCTWLKFLVLTAGYRELVTANDQHVAFLTKNKLPFREPRPSTFRTAVVTAQRNSRIHACALAGIEILHTNSPDSFIGLVIHSQSKYQWSI